MFFIRDAIHYQSLVETLKDFHSGAEVIFTGKVRNHSEGRAVLFLEYEAYEAMAENLIRDLIVTTYL